jgi:NAD(P)-dependent dehydrogenase (short-subunit alcohol dehydrogenase family)
MIWVTRRVEPDAFRRAIETNLIGAFHTVRAALPSTIDQRGYVLVVASVSFHTAVPAMAAHGASKAGVARGPCGGWSGFRELFGQVG